MSAKDRNFEGCNNERKNGRVVHLKWDGAGEIVHGPKLTKIPPDKNHDDDYGKRHRVFHERVHAARRFIVWGHKSFSIAMTIGHVEREPDKSHAFKPRSRGTPPPAYRSLGPAKRWQFNPEIFPWIGIALRATGSR